MSARAHGLSLAIASGVLLTLSFPKFGHPAFAWIALAPLLVALVFEPRTPNPESLARSLMRAFALGLTTGIVYFTGTLYWITRTISVYGGLQVWVAVLVNGALIAYMALFPAIFAVVMRRLVFSLGAGALMTAPLVWVTTELGRTHLFTGFPWVLLGYSQVTMLPIAQLASVFGVYGVSALVASVSAAAALVVTGRGVGGWGRWAGWGGWVRLRRLQPWCCSSRCGAVYGPRRPNGPAPASRSRWGSSRATSIRPKNGTPIGPRPSFRRTSTCRARRLARAPSSCCGPSRRRPFSSTKIAKAPIACERWRGRRGCRSCSGRDQIERGRPDKYYNSAFLVGADGTTAGIYRKMHLVPLGEYVPLKRLFYFAAPLVEAAGDFSAGEAAVILPVRGHLISTAICYEVVYPDLVRRFVAGGSELLTAITNDAWFGRTSAPYQHFAQASMRAIEEGRYLVRSANTGISGIVDPYGRVLAQSDIFQPAVIVGRARFLTGLTFYARHGDIFAYASVVFTLVALILARRRVQ